MFSFCFCVSEIFFQLLSGLTRQSLCGVNWRKCPKRTTDLVVVVAIPCVVARVVSQWTTELYTFSCSLQSVRPGGLRAPVCDARNQGTVPVHHQVLVLRQVCVCVSHVCLRQCVPRLRRLWLSKQRPKNETDRTFPVCCSLDIQRKVFGKFLVK